MEKNIPILFSEKQISERLNELVKLINEDYAGKNNLLIICILQGSFHFSTALVRKINVPFTLDFMEISSYKGGKTPSGNIELIRDLQQDPRGRHVLVLEDIVDTGATLNFIYNHLQKKEPSSIETAALLIKKKSLGHSPPVRYNGFMVDNHFTVGYGMDYQGKHRDLPYIGYID